MFREFVDKSNLILNCKKYFRVENATIFVPSGADLDHVRLHEAEIDEIAKRVEEKWKDVSCLDESLIDKQLGIVRFEQNHLRNLIDKANSKISFIIVNTILLICYGITNTVFCTIKSYLL